MRKSVTAVTAALATVLGLAACTGGTAHVDPPAAASTQDQAAAPAGDKAADKAAEQPAAEVGTRENPAPAGSTATLTDWTVVIGPTNRDASADIAAANQFNPPAPAGRSFIMAPVTATYTGTQTATAWVSLSIQFVGNAGNTYGLGSDDYCGVAPSPLSDSGELYPNATATGNECVAVPTAEIEGGTWVVENQLAFDDVKAFFALQ